MLSPSVATEHPYSLRDWDQIENEAEVSRVLRRIQIAKRFNVYQRVDLYERVYPGYPGDREFYAARGATGRVLYLGSGTGRIFGLIARQNPDAVGIDNSAEMMTVLRQRFADIPDHQLLLGDACRTELPTAHFDTVLAPYSFLQVVPSQDLPILLRNVQRSLRDGGKFIADVFSPYLIPFRRGGLEANVFEIAAEMRVGIYVCYDHLRQHMKEMALFDNNGDSTVLEMHLDYYFPRELSDKFLAAALAEPQIAGNYRGEPFDPINSDIMVIESTRPPNGYG